MPLISELSVSFQQRALATMCAVLVAGIVGIWMAWRRDALRSEVERLKAERRHDKELAGLNAVLLEEARANAKTGVEFMHAVKQLEMARETMMSRLREFSQ